jgi:MFS family permease
VSRPAAEPERPGGAANGGGTARRRAVLWAPVVASGVVWIPTTGIAIALPTLHAEFGTSISELAWIPGIYTLAFATVLLLAGRLVDRGGRRRFLIGGSSAFAVATLVASAAPSYGLLVTATAALGASSAFVTTSSLGVLEAAFSGPARTRAVSLWAAATAAGQAVGVPLAGLLLDTPLGWRAIFWVCAPIAAGVAIAAAWAVRESRDPDRGPLDLAGGLTAGISLALVGALGLQGPTWGLTSPATLGLLAAWLVVSAVALVATRRAEDPVVPTGLLRERQFAGGVAIAIVFNMCLVGALFVLPLFLEQARGAGTTLTGAVLLALTGAAAVSAPAGGPLAVRFGERTPLVGAMALTCLGMLLLSRLDATTSAPALLPGLLLAGAGIGLATSLSATAAMAVVPPPRAASAIAVFGGAALMGSTFGTALAAGLFDVIAGPDAARALADGDATAIADGASGPLLALAGVAAAGIVVALVAVGRRGGGPGDGSARVQA